MYVQLVTALLAGLLGAVHGQEEPESATAYDDVTPTRAVDDDSLRGVDKIIIGVAGATTILVAICAAIIGYSKRKQIKKERNKVYHQATTNAQRTFESSSGLDNLGYVPAEEKKTGPLESGADPDMKKQQHIAIVNEVYDNMLDKDRYSRSSSSDLVPSTSTSAGTAPSTSLSSFPPRRASEASGSSSSSSSSSSSDSSVSAIRSRSHKSDQDEAVVVPYEDIYESEASNIIHSSQL